ncbi:LysR family transcriptional regulator [Paraburkholderia fungorum]|uniref:LysR family transcriptional regulator n=1 Tax=Paraburkholderia fungorum TaxID=134537 RepID=UPI0023DEDFE9|nr:LysR family transcriptional regulator [Paraburkholderia fungorum]
MLAFESVARHRSFAKAAAEMEVSTTAISKAVKKLERGLGARLLNRTTRSVGLTDEGATLLNALGPALEQVRSSVRLVGESTAKPKGQLKINTSYVAYISLVHPHLAEFSRRFPEITIEVTTDNSLTDIVAEGHDLGIRLGHIVEDDMVGVPTGGRQQLVVVGAPTYLTTFGVPRKTADLSKHNCIRHRVGEPARFFEWRLMEDGIPESFAVEGGLVYSDMRGALEAAKAGLGLAYVFRQFVEPDLQRGELIALLEDYSPATSQFYMYFANKAHMSCKMRAFIDFFKEANQPRRRLDSLEANAIQCSALADASASRECLHAN